MRLQRIFAASGFAVLLASAAPAVVPSIPLDPVSPSPWSPSVAFVAPPAPVVAKPVTAAAPVQAARRQLSEPDREIVAACLVLEAASQGKYGMRGVMSVIRNRAHGLPREFAATVLEPKQFSSLNRYTAGRESLWRVMHRAKQDRMWPSALEIVDDATRDSWRDPTGGATHYTRLGEHTAWTRALARTTIIGRHAFYR